MTTPYLHMDRRPFPVALAHRAACLPLSEQAEWQRIGRIVINMTSVARLAFLGELHLCREAQRNPRAAEIVWNK